MSKNSILAFASNEVKPVIVLLAQDEKAREMFANKTLAEIGKELDLFDEDVEVVETGSGIKNLCIYHNGKQYLCSLSRGFDLAMTEDPAYMLDCVFRVNNPYQRNAEGEILTDEEGNYLLDTSRVTVSFGKPGGITITERSRVFTADKLPEQQRAASTAGAAGRVAKPATAAK